jgi:undecaprenyl-diphosphatase
MNIITTVDNAVLTFIQGFRSPVADVFFAAVTRLGDAGILWIVIGAVCLLLPRAKKCGISVFISLLITFILTDIVLKPAAARLRPFIADGVTLIIDAPYGYSFPSGHTATAFAAATAIFIFNRRAGQWSYAAAILIGFSRAYLYVHYPSDIIAGAVIGIVAGAASGIMIKKLRIRRC